MPHPSIYYTEDKKDYYTPDTFQKTYNRYKSLEAASKGMNISRMRLSIIAHRLRRRGWNVVFRGSKPLSRKDISNGK